MFLNTWNVSFYDEKAVEEHKPWSTLLILATCLALWVGLIYNDHYKTLGGLEQWGYRRSDQIWSGAYWALISSAFMHIEAWHLAGNAYWIWALGHRLEHALGSRRFLAFYLAAAFVSSSFQLFFGDNAGIGASGAVYAMFGLMLVTRRRFPYFRRILDFKNITAAILWLFVCLAASESGMIAIGNAAHFSGFAFGILVAACFVLDFKRRLMRPVLGTFAALSFIPLFWCPGSVAWLGHKAWRAHTAQRFKEAIAYYDRIIRIDPEDAWAYHNRGAAEYSLGDYLTAMADDKKAKQLEAAQKEKKEDQDP